MTSIVMGGATRSRPATRMCEDDKDRDEPAGRRDDDDDGRGDEVEVERKERERRPTTRTSLAPHVQS